MYGSLFFIALRCVVAIIYYATQTFYAAQLLIVMLRCAFGHNWTDLPNHLPKSAGITSSHLGAFFLLWFIQVGTSPVRRNREFKLRIVSYQ